MKKAAHTDTQTAEQEMNVIMSENDQTHSTFHSSFSRLCTHELNDMGFGLNRISHIIMDAEKFQTLHNRGTQSRVVASTPRQWEELPATAGHYEGSCPTTWVPHMNRTYPMPQPPEGPFGAQRSTSYDADISARENTAPRGGRFIPPYQTGPPAPESVPQEPPQETAIGSAISVCKLGKFT